MKKRKLKFSIKLEVNSPVNSLYYNGTLNAPKLTIKAALELSIKSSREEMGSSCRLMQRDFPDNSYEIERRNSKVRCNLFVEATSWKAKVSLEDGIRDTIRAYLKEP